MMLRYMYKRLKLLFALTILVQIVTLIWLLSSKFSKATTSRSPHIVLILADDLGWADVSWHNPNIISPNLERLAREGVILNSSYVFPRCTPSRASLLTGYYPHRIGMQYGVSSRGETSLPLTFDLLPERLKEIGYSTHMVGKWHLGYCSVNHTPSHRGFDSFFGYYDGHQSYFTHTVQNLYDFHFNDAIFFDSKQQYSTFLFRDRVRDILSEHDLNDPLFLYLALQAVHDPLQAPEKYIKMYPNLPKARATYLGMVTAMDEAIGDIMSILESKGFMDNLLMVFLSDNGGHPIKGGYNWPLRGVKNTLWEGGTRSAGFVYSKTLLEKRQYTSNHIINIVDWFPTLLEASGSEVNSNGMDGVSQWESIAKGGYPARTESVYGIEERAAIRVGDYKLIKGHPGCPKNSHYATCVPLNRMDNGWTAPNELQTRSVPSDTEFKDFLLYNLRTDPLEKHDISEENVALMERLKSRLEYHTERAVQAIQPVATSEKFVKMTNKHKMVLSGWCD